MICTSVSKPGELFAQFAQVPDGLYVAGKGLPHQKRWMSAGGTCRRGSRGVWICLRDKEGARRACQADKLVGNGLAHIHQSRPMAAEGDRELRAKQCVRREPRCG